ncbi:MAG: hypothetical protein ACOVMM_04915 [Chitinophagaceae bacterium]
MNCKILSLLFCISFIVSCNSTNNQPPLETVKDTTNFYPLNVMLDNQLADLQRSPFYIYKKTTINNKMVDSIAFPLDSLYKVIQQFKQYNIDTVGKKEYYTESSFQDLSTNSISLVYTTTNSNMEVINQTILLNQDNNNLKNALVRVIQKGTNYQIQYNFKPNKSLRISTIKQQNGSEDVVENVFINWNDTE